MYSTAMDPQLDSSFPSSIHTFQVGCKLGASLTPQAKWFALYFLSCRRTTSGPMEELKHLLVKLFLHSQHLPFSYMRTL